MNQPDALNIAQLLMDVTRTCRQSQKQKMDEGKRRHDAHQLSVTGRQIEAPNSFF
jgi:hypothetical protein